MRWHKDKNFLLSRCLDVYNFVLAINVVNPNLKNQAD